MDDTGGIHYEHPFATPVEERDVARRFRGRLAAPVTVWTAGEGVGRSGLTISSLLVVDGEPAFVAGLVSDVTDLWVAVHASGAFVVHVLRASQRALSERFALRRPALGGLFAGLEVTPSRWGPVLADVPTRAYCLLEGVSALGERQLVTGRIDAIDVDEDFDDPLVYFRGQYRAP